MAVGYRFRLPLQNFYIGRVFMAKYKKCPRCELNYITQDQDMCDICKAELGLDSKIVLLDDIIDDDEPLKLCPVCKTAYIGLDEEMCESCLANEQQSHEETIDDDNDDWRTYLDDEDTEPTEEEDVIPLEELEKDDDFKQDEFEDEENPDTSLDDYPDDFDDGYNYDDDGVDDDDDDEEDEEDEDYE